MNASQDKNSPLNGRISTSVCCEPPAWPSTAGGSGGDGERGGGGNNAILGGLPSFLAQIR